MTKEISVKEAKTCIDNGAIVLDVRTKEEYDSGHIKGSINIDIHDVVFDEKISDLGKEKSYIIYCASGVRSLVAVGKMMDAGFVDVHSMAGGILEWKSDGMEVEV